MAWHHENFSLLRNSQAGRDQRPERCPLRYHNPWLSPLTMRFVPKSGGGGRCGELAHSPLLQNRLGKWTVSRRVDASMATSEHC